MKDTKQPATLDWLLNGPAPKYEYRIPVLVLDGKHSPTTRVVKSHRPPSKEDVAFKSAHGRQGMPTGC